MTLLGGFRERFHTPGPLTSAMMLIPDPAVAAILGLTGFDYVILDTEHGPYTLDSLRACVEALIMTGARTVVRTGSGDSGEIQRVLDLGVDGILVPHIDRAKAAESVVRAARYPPDGERGIGGGTRATRYGLDGGEYVERANASIVVMVMIESEVGVENAREIAAVEGLDGILVGPTDLAADLGIPGELNHPRVAGAAKEVTDAAIWAGLKAGPNTQGPWTDEASSLLTLCFLDTNGLANAAASALASAHAPSE